MVNFQVLPLPEEFNYPFTPERLQGLLSSAQINTQLVLFSGLPELYSPGFVGSRMVLCTVGAQRSGSSYVFSIEVNGVRADRIRGHEEELSQELLSHLKGWMVSKAKQAPPIHYQTPARLNLVLELKGMELLVHTIVVG